MATRTPHKQSEHDGVVVAAQRIYSHKGKHAWINPGSEKNKTWCARYIDVIAVGMAGGTSAWVIEVETADSVNDGEASGQWHDYDSAYEPRWYLAVPQESKSQAEALLIKYGLSHCTVITWRRNPNGSHTFWGLPGLN